MRSRRKQHPRSCRSWNRRVKVSDFQRVMDGDLEAFIQAYLKQYGGSAA